MELEPRIKRRNTPSRIRKNKKQFRKDALPALLVDFGQRCAYCMSHSQYVGGDDAFKIDHFHPSSKGGSFTDYANLFLACDQCNMHKRDFWPNKVEQQQGARLLNCTKEADYDVLLFENANGEIVPNPVSKPAIYHSRVLRLNRVDLVKARIMRTRLVSRLKDKNRLAQMRLTLEKVNELVNDVAELSQLINYLIPSIMPPASSVTDEIPR
jgi:hypothetical protein